MTDAPQSKAGDSDAVFADSISLIVRAQKGELPAYERLFERYYLRVRAIVRRKLGDALRKEMDSEDIVQEAMVQAIQAIETFEVRSSDMLLGWFARIVENRICALDRRSRAQKRDRGRNVALDHMRDSISSGILRLEPAGDEPEVIENLIREEEVEEVRRMLDTLSERQRTVIRLRDEEGLGWAEVAKAMGLASADAARMLHARTRVQLMKPVRQAAKDAAEKGE